MSDKQEPAAPVKVVTRPSTLSRLGRDDATIVGHDDSGKEIPVRLSSIDLDAYVERSVDAVGAGHSGTYIAIGGGRRVRVWEDKPST